MGTVHSQVLTRVLVPVDKGVKALIDVLTDLGAQTTSSCEGPPATVWFQYGRSWNLDEWEDLCGFVFTVVAPALRHLGDLAIVSVEHHGGAPQPYGLLRVRDGCVDDVTEALRGVTEAVSRSSGFSDGKGDTWRSGC